MAKRTLFRVTLVVLTMLLSLEITILLTPQDQILQDYQQFWKWYYNCQAAQPNWAPQPLGGWSSNPIFDGAGTEVSECSNRWFVHIEQPSVSPDSFVLIVMPRQLYDDASPNEYNRLQQRFVVETQDVDKEGWEGFVKKPQWCSAISSCVVIIKSQSLLPGNS